IFPVDSELFGPRLVRRLIFSRIHSRIVRFVTHGVRCPQSGATSTADQRPYVFPSSQLPLQIILLKDPCAIEVIQLRFYCPQPVA
ncbi:MAG TPA: hypothetical protein VGB94_05535, partial [Acidobacteriaceae bacterium]